jgi:PAS domain S-box-containing protein
MTTSVPSRNWGLVIGSVIAVVSATTAVLLVHETTPGSVAGSAPELFLCVAMSVGLAAGPGLAAFTCALMLLFLGMSIFSFGRLSDFDTGEVCQLALFVVAAGLIVALSSVRKRATNLAQMLLNERQLVIRRLQEENERIRTENTEYSAAASRARAAEQELRQTVESVPAMIARYRPDGFMDFRNGKWREYTGLSQENSEGRRWGSALHPDDEQMVERAWREHIGRRKPFELEQRLRRADGTYRRSRLTSMTEGAPKVHCGKARRTWPKPGMSFS